MNEFDCSSCLFGDECGARHPCAYYTPVAEYGDGEISRYVEDRRYDFRKEWRQYVSDGGQQNTSRLFEEAMWADRATQMSRFGSGIG